VSDTRLRLSFTNRCRLMLALSPIVIPLSLFYLLGCAAVDAAKAFVSTVTDGIGYYRDWWYREVYRPARYGSVWDDVDETGWPKAWGTRRGSGV